MHEIKKESRENTNRGFFFFYSEKTDMEGESTSRFVVFYFSHSETDMEGKTLRRIWRLRDENLIKT